MKTLQIDDEFGERLAVAVLTEDYKDRLLEPESYDDRPKVMKAYKVLLDYYMNPGEKESFAEWLNIKEILDN